MAIVSRDDKSVFFFALWLFLCRNAFILNVQFSAHLKEWRRSQFIGRKWDLWEWEAKCTRKKLNPIFFDQNFKREVVVRTCCTVDTWLSSFTSVCSLWLNFLDNGIGQKGRTSWLLPLAGRSLAIHETLFIDMFQPFKSHDVHLRTRRKPHRCPFGIPFHLAILMGTVWDRPRQTKMVRRRRFLLFLPGNL